MQEKGMVVNMKEGQCKVSVIIPVYNEEKYLSECLNSVKNQTFKDIEIIIINDGSTDSSRMIAQQFVEHNSNVLLINQENQGLSVSRNKGIENAKGEYLCFLDSDDMLPPEALRELYNFADEYKLDVVKFAAYTFSDDTGTDKVDTTTYKYHNDYTKVYSGNEMLGFLVEHLNDYYACSCLMLVRRNVIFDNNLSYLPNIVYEDELFHFELLSVAQRVMVYSKPMYYSRVHSNSIMSTPNWDRKMLSYVAIVRRMMNKTALHEDEVFWKYIELFIAGAISDWYKIPNRRKKHEEIKSSVKEIQGYINQCFVCTRKSVRIFGTNPYLYLGLLKLRYFFTK